MLGVYLVIVQMFHNISSILNTCKLTLQKGLHNFMTNNGFWTIKVKSQQQNKHSNIKILVRAGNRTWVL